MSCIQHVAFTGQYESGLSSLCKSIQCINFNIPEHYAHTHDRLSHDHPDVPRPLQLPRGNTSRYIVLDINRNDVIFPFFSLLSSTIACFRLKFLFTRLSHLAKHNLSVDLRNRLTSVRRKITSQYQSKTFQSKLTSNQGGRTIIIPKSIGANIIYIPFSVINELH